MVALLVEQVRRIKLVTWYLTNQMHEKVDLIASEATSSIDTGPVMNLSMCAHSDKQIIGGESLQQDN